MTKAEVIMEKIAQVEKTSGVINKAKDLGRAVILGTTKPQKAVSKVIEKHLPATADALSKGTTSPMFGATEAGVASGVVIDAAKKLKGPAKAAIEGVRHLWDKHILGKSQTQMLFEQIKRNLN